MRRPDPKYLACAAILLGASVIPAANAGEKRIEYRYPDRPDLVFSPNGVARAADPNRPIAFSAFENAISVADARSVVGPTSSNLMSEAPRRVEPKPTFVEDDFVSTAVVAEGSYTSDAPSATFTTVPRTPQTVSNTGDFAIQTGAFSSYANANSLASKLSAYGSTRISEGYSNGKPIYRVMLGGWNSRSAANPMLDLIKARGFDGFVTGNN